MKKKLMIDGNEFEVELISQNDQGLKFALDGQEWSFSNLTEQAVYSLNEHAALQRFSLISAKKAGVTYVATGTRSLIVQDAALVKGKTTAHAGAMVSPMPGKILKVLKKAGDSVKTGETILVMEAMKMEHAIKAPAEGIVAKVSYAEGDQVEGGVLLVELEGRDE